MRRYIPILLLAAFFSAEKCAPAKKTMYELPAEMSESVRADYTRQCEKGKILYDINCSRCHTTKVRGKEVIPDFTAQQLIGYELRISNARHEVNLSDSAITGEELGLIMTFLTYKKKNTKQ